MWPHSWTPIEDGEDEPRRWKAFAEASKAVVNSPMWTMGDDPKHDQPPPDAAGRLWRAHEHEGKSVPTTIAEALQWLAAEFSVDDDPDIEKEALGAYFSSGAAGIFLFRIGLSYYILIVRDNPDPYFGNREDFLQEMGYSPVIVENPPQIGEVTYTY